ncbi:MAG: Rdx family protein [Proteobacteria bacterium]|nr:Rdx family protein [Pseudomonadota bacterium]
MDKIKREMNVEAKLQPSGGGVFEVTVDGTLVYSKKKTGQFPNENDLLNQLKKL